MDSQPDLTIRIPRGQRRRFAYGDNRAGYLSLLAGEARAGDEDEPHGTGYRSAGALLLLDLTLALVDKRGSRLILERSGAEETGLQPDGFSLRFVLPSGDQASLHVSLLSGRQALALRLDLPPSAPAAEIILRVPRPAGPYGPRQPDGFACASAPALADMAAPAAQTAPAVATSETVAGLARHRAGPAGRRSGRLFRLRPAAGWADRILYVAWATDGQAAPGAALACAEGNGWRAHRELIADVLTRASLVTGEAAFDAALRWCIVSGWFLVSDEYGRGIWAGLPWFRDNWGRDTFIALPGTLLATGRFAEAREVLLTFARWQMADPAHPAFGRVPNRVSQPADIIYNTADGTLWFVRAALEYLEHTGDLDFARLIFPAVERAIRADQARLDPSDFLKHADADTWMDAKIDGELPWSARGDRAVEIQALWYTALHAAARIAEASEADNSAGPAQGPPAGPSGFARAELAAAWRSLANRVKESFPGAFWKADEAIMADRLGPAAAGGPADWRNRPNQLFCATVPAILDAGGDSAQDAAFLPAGLEAAVTQRVVSRLLYPWGLASLDQADPIFHPAHDESALYHKDAAYHNGTVWLWNSGPAIEALCRGGRQDLAWRHSAELSARVLTGSGCAGSLPENLHALPDGDGRIRESGTWSQAWSVAEFTRSAFQAYLGFKPRLLSGCLLLEPALPAQLGRVRARLPFGAGDALQLDLERRPERDVWTLTWTPGPDRHTRRGLQLDFRPAGQTGRQAFLVPLVPEQTLRLEWAPAAGQLLAGDRPVPAGPAPERPVLGAGLDFARPALPHWNPAVRQPHFLRRLIEAGRYDAGPRAALEKIFSSAGFERDWHYDGALGALWSPEGCEFRLWAPTAERVCLALYPSGDSSPADTVLDMAPGGRGVWQASLPGDLHGRYYDYEVCAHGRVRRACDPYARSAGLNGQRAMVIDLARAEPAGWAAVAAPPLASPADAVVAEVHVADLTSHRSWTGPESARRSYLGAAARGTAWSPGDGQPAVPTGLEHFITLGVTHLQLLPVFDFDTVDEARVREPEYRARRYQGAFNWGYDPANYSVPEGSYSSDPADGGTRVRELRALVAASAKAGLGVIMDVVYNHMPDINRSCLEVCVPGYYFRAEDYSGAGPDTASERSMYRAFMVDSLCHWLAAYKLAGFRFDLMGLHDVTTMNRLESALRAIKPDVLLYGEGWDMYRGQAMQAASMLNAGRLGQIGMFNDAFRCAVKGSIFEPFAPGWLHDGRQAEALKFGIVGAVRHPQVRAAKVQGTINPRPWSEAPWRSITYTEIHDNLTLHDKLRLVEPEASPERLERLARLALTLILCAEGLPILHAGMEFLRSKEYPASWIEAGGLRKVFWSQDGKRAFCHDSYNCSDQINGLDWSRAWACRATVAYLRGLIALRRAHPLFRLRSGRELRRRLSFVRQAPSLLAWRLDGRGSDEAWPGIIVAANANREELLFKLPPGNWAVVADGQTIHPEGYGCHTRHLSLPAEAAVILRRLA